MRRHRIAVIPGDGIGREVTPAALEVLEAAGRAHGFALDLPEYPWGCDYFVATGRMMPVDALAAMVVLDPGRFDVIVASNLFGDILSDLAAAVAGSIGIAPSGNLNPERDHPSMFEPVHGSAPDIAGQGVANPIGAIWSGAQMLEHLGETEAATAVLAALEGMLAGDGPRTRDLGGTATTADVTGALVSSFTSA